MDEQLIHPHRRRHRKSAWELFKEQYLPALILLTAIITILCMMFGAVTA